MVIEENLKDTKLDWLIDIDNLLLSSSKYRFIASEDNTLIASFDMHAFLGDDQSIQQSKRVLFVDEYSRGKDLEEIL